MTMTIMRIRTDSQSEKVINKYFEYEPYVQHCIQLPINDANCFDEETDDKGESLIGGSYAIKWKDKNDILMKQYHVNYQPDYFQSMLQSDIWW